MPEGVRGQSDGISKVLRDHWRLVRACGSSILVAVRGPVAAASADASVFDLYTGNRPVSTGDGFLGQNERVRRSLLLRGRTRSCGAALHRPMILTQILLSAKDK